MNKIIISVFFLLLNVNQIICPAFASNMAPEKNSVFQVATIGSLTQGVYDGNYAYRSLMKHGDFGVGTFLDLNGEMVAIDGHFYQIEANGKLKAVTEKQIVPFAEVTFFKPTIYKNLANINAYQALGNKLLHTIVNQNIPYAIRIDGTFKLLKLRSLRKQKKPYPPLTQASEEQAIFNLQNITGSIVGFWFPAYWSGIAVPGYHLHFVTQDRKTGGHVLEINLSKGRLSMAPLYQFEVHLPNTKSFSQADLSSKELSASIKKAEGGTQ